MKSPTVTIVTIAIYTVAIFLSLVNQIFTTNNQYFISITLASVIVMLILLWSAWRGWAYADIVIVVITVMALIPSLPEENVTQKASFIVMIPPALAMVLLTPRWIIISAVVTLLGLFLRGGWQTVYIETTYLLSYGIIVSCLVAGWTIGHHAFQQAEQARADSDQTAHELQLVNSSLEQRVAERTAEVQANLLEIQTQAANQAKLFHEIEQQRHTIRDLSVPVIPVNDHSMVMPLVGEIDSQRLALIQTQALQAIERHRAHTLVFDITGVPLVDAPIAQGLMTVAQSARLLGTRVILVGIRPEVAQTMVSLNMDIGSISTYRDLKSALDTFAA